MFSVSIDSKRVNGGTIETTGKGFGRQGMHAGISVRAAGNRLTREAVCKSDRERGYTEAYFRCGASGWNGNFKATTRPGQSPGTKFPRKRDLGAVGDDDHGEW